MSNLPNDLPNWMALSRATFSEESKRSDPLFSVRILASDSSESMEIGSEKKRALAALRFE